MRLDGLDSLRGIFALMIVFLHTGFQSNLFYLDFVRNSGIFVEFFFVLSGFVISLSYAEKARQPYALPEFMIRRVGRLWPLHMAVLLGFVALILLKALAEVLGLFSANLPYTGSEITGFIVENVFLVQAFRNETVLWLNFPSWSISAELWAYALFGLICLAPVRLVPWLVTFTGMLAFCVLRGWIEPGFGEFVGYGLFRGICYFMMGHLCYLVWLRVRHATLPVASGIEIGAVILIIVQTIYSEHSLVEALMPLTFAATILIFTYEAGVVSRILSHRVFQVLGQRSYSIYMVHALVLAVVGLIVRFVERLSGTSLYSANLMDTGTPMLVDFGPAWMMDIATIGLAVFVVWLAGLTYRYIEMTGQSYSNGMIKSWRKSRAGA